MGSAYPGWEGEGSACPELEGVGSAYPGWEGEGSAYPGWEGEGSAYPGWEWEGSAYPGWEGEGLAMSWVAIVFVPPLWQLAVLAVKGTRPSMLRPKQILTYTMWHNGQTSLELN